MLKDVARIQIGPEMRRGIAELDGQGEVTGGIVIMRHGKNALTTHRGGEGEDGGVEGEPAIRGRDRRDLRPLRADRAFRAPPRDKAAEEFAVVADGLPRLPPPPAQRLRRHRDAAAGVLAAFIVMHYQGVNANIMSLGGIAIAIGAMVDAAIVMIENAHKRLEGVAALPSRRGAVGPERWRVIR
jgi:Cu(I)/Ag(I) efflux system membrane protein CusA/SilA